MAKETKKGRHREDPALEWSNLEEGETPTLRELLDWIEGLPSSLLETRVVVRNKDNVSWIAVRAKG